MRISYQMGQKDIHVESAQLCWPVKLSSSNPIDELKLKCRTGRVQHMCSWDISLHKDPFCCRTY